MARIRGGDRLGLPLDRRTGAGLHTALASIVAIIDTG